VEVISASIKDKIFVQTSLGTFIRTLQKLILIHLISITKKALSGKEKRGLFRAILLYNCIRARKRGEGVWEKEKIVVFTALDHKIWETIGKRTFLRKRRLTVPVLIGYNTICIFPRGG